MENTAHARNWCTEEYIMIERVIHISHNRLVYELHFLSKEEKRVNIANAKRAQFKQCKM